MAKYAICVGFYLQRNMAVFGSVLLYHTVTHDFITSSPGAADIPFRTQQARTEEHCILIFLPCILDTAVSQENI